MCVERLQKANTPILFPSGMSISTRNLPVRKERLTPIMAADMESADNPESPKRAVMTTTTASFNPTSTNDQSPLGEQHERIVVHTKPSLDSLPNDIIFTIISYLPRLPPITTSRHLKHAYELLSLARTQNRCADLSHVQASYVMKIDPFPNISHMDLLAHLPPYARTSFLKLLVRISHNLHTLRAPSLGGILQYAGKSLRHLAFINTGLTNLDFECISSSEITHVQVAYPTRPLLQALAKVKTLQRVTLRRIPERVISSLMTFFSHTTATALSIDLDSTSDDLLLHILHELPPLRKFVLHCDMRQSWWVLRYMRVIALKVDKAEVVVGGVNIQIRKLNALNGDSDAWETSILRRLVFRKDMGNNELARNWDDDMSLQEIDFEVLEEASKRGIRDTDVDLLLASYCMKARDFDKLTVRFGRTIPSLMLAAKRATRMHETGLSLCTRRLVISQDAVLLVRTQHERWSHNYFLSSLTNEFCGIPVIHLCRPSAVRRVSPRFVIALLQFLEVLLEGSTSLQCVYMENAGELFLQTSGLPVFTDRRRLKELIRNVIIHIKQMEVDHKVEMGTVVAQLEVWARMRKYRVANRKDLDDNVATPIDC